MRLAVFNWHRDMSDSKERRFCETLAHIQMTTAESLVIMLTSDRTDAKTLFSSFSAVIAHELHAIGAFDLSARRTSPLSCSVAMTGHARGSRSGNR